MSAPAFPVQNQEEIRTRLLRATHPSSSFTTASMYAALFGPQLPTLGNPVLVTSPIALLGRDGLPLAELALKKLSSSLAGVVTSGLIGATAATVCGLSGADSTMWNVVASESG